LRRCFFRAPQFVQSSVPSSLELVGDKPVVSVTTVELPRRVWPNGGDRGLGGKVLKGLEGENAKLKEPLADAMLDNAALKGSDKR
jgi:hypothetical protein